MKNFVKILGIIALIAVIGFGMTACGDSGGGGGNCPAGGCDGVRMFCSNDSCSACEEGAPEGTTCNC